MVAGLAYYLAMKETPAALANQKQFYLTKFNEAAFMDREGGSSKFVGS